MSWSALIVLACALVYVQGHGRLMDPPNRASIWRFGYSSPANYDDDGLNCGGFYHQWSVNDGKCGICGDAYDRAQPRPHELGGTYGVGYIVENYKAGQVIDVNVYLSASHLGYWELRICPDPYNQVQECFDNGYLLELEEGGTKYYPNPSGTYELKYRLPAGLTCEHCVLQWKYTCGNNWGVCDNGTQGLGCGNQEHFFSCSDISIGGATEAVSTPLVDGLTHDFINLSDIEIELLIRKMQLLGFEVVTATISPNRPSAPKKKYSNKHRRKKTDKNKAKTKRYKKMIYWR